nr:hypothetical protein [uncultured Campylobacter sp.]
MAITWAQALDYDKVTIVSHNGSYTRTLIEKSGYFAVQILRPRRRSWLASWAPKTTRALITLTR